MACASKACGCMSARPRPSPRRKRRFRRRTCAMRACVSLRLDAGQTQRLHHSRLGAVSADADRCDAPWQTGRGFPAPAIRSNSPAPRSICRPARLPSRPRCLSRADRWRRRDPAAHRRRSATSMRTRSPSPKRPPARWPPRRFRCRRRSDRSSAACCWRELILKWAQLAGGARRRRRAADRQYAARCAGARRRSGAPDGRHDDRQVDWKQLDELVPRRSRPLLAACRSTSCRSRARRGRPFAPNAAPSKPRSGATS